MKINLANFLLLVSLLLGTSVLAQEDPDTPTAGGSITLGRVSDVRNFDPTHLATANNIMTLQLYNTLVELAPDLSVQPELATSWELAEDATSLTLQLRDDVTFHTGREFTARDVAATVERYQDESVGATLRGGAMAIESVEVVDDYTVILYFTAPQPTIVDFLDMMFITDVETADSIATNPVGTGPFMLDRHVPGNEIRFVRNPDYWQEGLPYLDEIVVRVIGDQAALVANLETATVDWVERPSYRDLSYLDSLPGVEVTIPPGAPLTTSIQINTENPPLDDVRVRKAIDLAIDRERYTELYFDGFAEPIWTSPSLHALVKDEDWYQSLERDVDRARELLVEAGHADGFSVDMIITTSILHTGGSVLAELVQQDLAEIGIDVNIDVAEGAAYGDRSRAGDFDLRGAGYGRANRDPAALLSATSAFRTDSNISNYYDDRYVALVEEALTTVDEQERIQLYREIARFVVDEAFILTLAPAFAFGAGYDYIQDISSNREGFFSFEEARVDR